MACKPVAARHESPRGSVQHPPGAAQVAVLVEVPPVPALPLMPVVPPAPPEPPLPPEKVLGRFTSVASEPE
jgi:hypothetical protein